MLLATNARGRLCLPHGGSRLFAHVVTGQPTPSHVLYTITSHQPKIYVFSILNQPIYLFSSRRIITMTTSLLRRQLEEIRNTLVKASDQREAELRNRERLVVGRVTTGKSEG